MSGKSTQKYTEEFKKTIVNLYQSGKTYSQISQEYGISHSALANWIKKYSEVKMDDNTILTSRQIKELQKRNAQLEEENLILKKQYSLHPQATIDCGKSSFKSTFNHHSLQSSPCKQKHILQMAAPFSVLKRA